MKKTLLILFTAFTGYFAQAQTYYVNVNAVGTNDGSSWANAFTDLNNALSVVSTGEIWVAAGTYYPGTSGNTSATFAMKNNLSILGGFNGTETLATQRDPNTNVCILSGDLDASGTFTVNDAEHVVTAQDVDNTALLDGFSITGGNAVASGGGIYVNGVSAGTYDPQFKNLNVYGNYGDHGGGINVTVNYVVTNLAPKFTNCKVHHNKAFGWGGGIRIGSYGSGAFASPVFENVLIYADSSQTGGGIASEHANSGRADAVFINCTVANNPGAGTKIMFQTYGSPGTLTFNNCIMYGENVYATDTITANNSNFGINDTLYYVGANNVYDNPTYLNAAGGNFKPGCSAQAVNGGNNAYVTQPVDLDGITRIIGLAVDMGVYETNYPAGPTVTAHANFTSVCAPGSTNLILYGTGANTYTWTGASDSVPTTIISTATYTVTGYDANMCSGTDVITITVNAAPNVSLTADYTICETDSIFLQGSPFGGTLPYTFSWQDGALNVISTTNTDYYTPLASDGYTLTVTDANGCAGSDAMYVSVDASEVLTGTVYIGATPISTGTVYLFRMNALSLAYDTVSTYNITSGGFYYFPATPFGNYKLKVIADTTLYPNAIPTYYGGGFQWDSAGTIVHNCISTFAADVYLGTLLGGVGTGKITGKIIEAAGFGTRVADNGNNHVMVPGGPLKGVDVKLGKNPGGGVQARTTSDTSGTYTFNNLPDDSYRIYVDIPGLGMDSFYVVNLNSTIDTLVNLDYYADDNSVYPILPTAVGLQSNAGLNNATFGMYPNPAKTYTSLVFSSAKQNYATVHVFDVTGKQLMNIAITNLPIGKHEYQLNLSNQQLESGIYFVELISENGKQVKKLIVE